jgi:hypothetical protein
VSKKPESIRLHIKHSGLFSALQHKFEQNDKLLSLVKQQLPESLKKHCTAIQKQGQTLVLYVNAPVWATRMHFLSQQLCKAANVERVRIRVSAPVGEIQPPVSNPVHQARYSQKGAKALSQAAGDFEDEQIRNVLQRLAESVGKSN